MKDNNKNKYLLLIIIVLFLSLFLLLSTNSKVFAGYKKQGSSDKTLTLPNPLGNPDPNVNELIGQVINAVLGIVGSLALVMFIYGGLTWMTAAGNKEKIQKGKDILIWATIGLIIIFSAYAIVRFVLVDVLQGKTG